MSNHSTIKKPSAPAEESAQDWYVAPGSIPGEHFLIVAGHATAKIRTRNKQTLALIAAAPELLEACKALLAHGSFLRNGDAANNVAEQAVAAITKAEGQ